MKQREKFLANCCNRLKKRYETKCIFKKSARIRNPLDYLKGMSNPRQMRDASQSYLYKGPEQAVLYLLRSKPLLLGWTSRHSFTYTCNVLSCALSTNDKYAHYFWVLIQIILRKKKPIRPYNVVYFKLTRKMDKTCLRWLFPFSFNCFLVTDKSILKFKSTTFCKKYSENAVRLVCGETENVS